MARRNLPKPKEGHRHVVIENVPVDYAELFESWLKTTAKSKDITRVERFCEIALKGAREDFSDASIRESMATFRNRDEARRINRARLDTQNAPDDPEVH